MDGNNLMLKGQVMPPDDLKAVLDFAKSLRGTAAHRAEHGTPKGDWIVPVAGSETWPVARAMVEDVGGLPPNALFDEILVRMGERNLHSDWRNLDGSIIAELWTREAVAYPAPNGVFAAGVDFDDNGWIVPWEYLARINEIEEFVGMEGKALFIEPLEVQMLENRAVLIPDPEKTVVLSGFPQESRLGMADELTGMPLQARPAALEKLPKEGKRTLYRSPFAGLRFVSRCIRDIFTIDLSSTHYVQSDVARVGSRADFEALQNCLVKWEGME
jgi:hypothetical protein